MSLAKGLPRHVKGGRPAFHDQPAIDRLIAILLALTSEVSVLRDRVDTLETLGRDHGWLAAGAVDAHTPDLAERTVRDARRAAMLDRVLAVLDEEIAGLGGDDYWATIAEIEAGEA